MFYENRISTLRSKTQSLKYDLFNDNFSTEANDFTLKPARSKICYNIITGNNKLENGYGFKDLQSPTSETDLENESQVSIRGNEVSAIWDFKWYDFINKKNTYLLFYFNDEFKFCYTSLFEERPTTFILNSEYTKVPIGNRYAINGKDAMVFSEEERGLFVVTDTYHKYVDNAPVLLSICTHYDKLFAITAGARRSIVYTENKDILSWDDTNTKHLEFFDERGNLNKIISFNDYLYIFRDFGITKISSYSSEGDFSISHLYQSDGNIFSGSIASGGDNVYFFEKSGLKVFNGSSTKSVKLDCEQLLKNGDFSKCSGACFEGKYYLACKLNFDDEEIIGCENGEYVNNALFVYDETSGNISISRGLDIRQLQVLQNPYKSKLVACFYNDNKARVGQLTDDGQLFGQNLVKVWKSMKTELNQIDIDKRVSKLNILTKYACDVEIKSDKESKIYKLQGSDKVQEIKVNVLGKIFELKFSSSTNIEISYVQLEYRVRQ